MPRVAEGCEDSFAGDPAASLGVAVGPSAGLGAGPVGPAPSVELRVAGLPDPETGLEIPDLPLGGAGWSTPPLAAGLFGDRATRGLKSFWLTSSAYCFAPVSEKWIPSEA